jgi:hypothetical protein
MDLKQLPNGHWTYRNTPTRCVNGHPFGPRKVFVSSNPEAGIVWECVECGAKISGHDLA